MFKTFGYGDKIKNNSDENNIELLNKQDYRTPWDINRPIVNVYEETDSIYEFLNSFADYQLTDTGVFTNSLTHQFGITSDDFKRVTLQDTIHSTSIDKVYAKLKPGIAGVNYSGQKQQSLIVVNKPNLRSFERKTAETLGLFYHNEEENVIVKYNPITDTYKCKISKKLDPMSNITNYFYGCSDIIEYNNDLITGVNSLTLLETIYNEPDFNNFFVNEFSGDLTKFLLDSTIIEITVTGIKYWKILSGNIVLSTINDGFFLGSFNITNLNPVTITSINNDHIRYGEKVRVDIHGVSDTSYQINTVGGIELNSSKDFKVKNLFGSEFKVDATGNISFSGATALVTLANGYTISNANSSLSVTTAGNKTESYSGIVTETITGLTKTENTKNNILNIVGTQTIAVTSTKQETIDGAVTILEKSTKQETIQGNVTETITGNLKTENTINNTLNIVGTQTVAVTGNQIISATTTKQETITGAVTIWDKNTKQETIDGAVTILEKSTKQETVQGNVTEIFQADATETTIGKKTSSANKQEINGTVDILISAPIITFNAGPTGTINFIGQNNLIEGTTVQLEDNIIELNKDQTGVPSVGLFSGLEVNRGSQPKAQILFRESSDEFIIGLVGSLQALATRQDTIADTTIPFWNNVAKRYDASTVTVSGSALTGSLSGNADSATILKTTRAITLSGDVSGTANFNGSAAAAISTTVDATNLATINKIVKRDANADFSARIITANLVGNADSASVVPWAGITGRPLFGSNTFGGNSNARTIAHGLARIPTYVGITPSVTPAGYLGEIWYTCDISAIYVYNSGSATTSFTWMAF